MCALHVQNSCVFTDAGVLFVFAVRQDDCCKSKGRYQNIWYQILWHKESAANRSNQTAFWSLKYVGKLCATFRTIAIITIFLIGCF